MDKKIVLIGAGSASFGPATVKDISLSKVLPGSTIVLHDLNKEKLNMIYEIVKEENKIKNLGFNIEQTLDRASALKDADFVISSIEHGDRFFLRRQDNSIPRKHGTTELMAENGGPGGFFHSARQIPEILKIARDVKKYAPEAFFINFSNPMSRICLAIKRAIPDLKFVGLCHQIGFAHKHIPRMLDKSIQEKGIGSIEKIARLKKAKENIRITTGGLNHFAFIFGLTDLRTGKDLMPEFNAKCMDYFKDKWDRFEFADLTFEVYKRFGYFPYVGDNHLCEYIQFSKDYVKIEDILEWLDMMQSGGQRINKRVKKNFKRLQQGRYSKNSQLFREPSGERAIPIIEAIINDSNSYETAVNISNDKIIDNLPQDLVIECSAIVNKDGLHGVKLGKIPVNIAALLRIEASIQDVCVNAILKESKDLAIACLAMDVNCGSFEKAEKIFNEMVELQKEYLPNFK
ncbi:MAG: family 4 glycosyl hydrolase [Promethearchaeota archaeon]